MLSIPQIDNSLLLFPEGLTGKGKELEAGGFDFFNYLLGLQAPNQSSPAALPELLATSEQSARTNAVGNDRGADSALFSLFSESNLASQKTASDVLSSLPAGWTPRIDSSLPETSPMEQADEGKQIAKLVMDQMPKEAVQDATEMPMEVVSAKSFSTAKPADNSKDLEAKLIANQYGPRETLSSSKWIASQPIPKEEANSFSGVSPEKFNQTVIGKYQEQAQVKESAASQADGKEVFAFKPEEQSNTANKVAHHETSVKEATGKKRLGEISRGHSSFNGTELLSQVSGKGLAPQSDIRSLTDVKPHTIPQVAEKVETMVAQGGGKMVVRLSPPELGQVEVEVTARGKRVEIEMRSENGEAKSLLEQQLSDLKTAIADQDLVLTKLDVQVTRETTQSSNDLSFGDFNQRPSFSQAGLNSGERESRQPHQPVLNSSSHAQPSLSRENSVASSTSRVSRLGNGRVDFRI